MSRSLTILFILVTALAMSSLEALSNDAEQPIGKFSSGDITGWKEQTIFNTQKTIYSFVQENGKSVLMGKSANSASGLIYKIDLDPKRYPIIKWSWKIEHLLKKGNEKTRDGHDFAAKIYVIFPRGLFSSTRAIEYVWGNVMRKEETLRSPYSKNIVMIAVDAGEEHAGKWISHKRNFAEDYRISFGEEAPKVGAIAIMTDSDNTHESVVGYYGDIAILSAPKADGQKPREQQQKDKTPKEQPLKEHPAKEAPLKEQPKDQKPKDPSIKETLPKNHKPKDPLQKDHTTENGLPAPTPAVPQPATIR